ncbi:hypothetical protein BJ085DRAFT_32553 [Dimargaris cristalligena]|uniref:Uncharacterized protein n=1 Tax=Dimargaris cristalligena TaxID=215637 RepID=A0A4P9ZLT2_9FUNG|nr:hypothetical protein BJ085DRAFT_32553 [Dimargaris cristalligena]|eukprot:RKP33562.1 hypothetical protein BJ085DRAFT_32553 [Dimargaris cristalligena]
MPAFKLTSGIVVVVCLPSLAVSVAVAGQHSTNPVQESNAAPIYSLSDFYPIKGAITWRQSTGDLFEPPYRVDELGTMYGYTGMSTSNDQNIPASFDYNHYSAFGPPLDYQANAFPSQHYLLNPMLSTDFGESRYSSSYEKPEVVNNNCIKVNENLHSIAVDTGSKKYKYKGKHTFSLKLSKLLKAKALTSGSPRLIYALDWSKETRAIVPYFFTGEQGYLCDKFHDNKHLFTSSVRLSSMPIFGTPDEMERLFNEEIEIFMDKYPDN